LLLHPEELGSLGLDDAQRDKFIRRIYGSHDFINGGSRLCIWIEDRDLEEAQTIESLKARIEAVRSVRLASRDKGANALAKRAHQLKLMRIGTRSTIVVPGVSSESRDYLPCGLLSEESVVNNKNFALYDAPLWNMALIASRLHWVWIATVCVRLRTDFSYSNTLGWNTFPVPMLTEKNKADLTRIYIGRRFRNDTERLEKLFDIYTKMIAGQGTTKKPGAEASA
jgi:hypothetical protein